MMFVGWGGVECRSMVKKSDSGFILKIWHTGFADIKYGM